MPPRLKTLFNWLGTGLATLGIFFVINRLHFHWSELELSHFSPVEWFLIVFFSSAYSASNLLLALAWFCVLKHIKADISKRKAVRIYGLSQIAKYAPGNIFHLAGRQALGMAANIRATTLVKSSAWELGLIVVSGALFGWLVFPGFIKLNLYPFELFLFAGTTLLLAVAFGFYWGSNIRRAFLLQVCFLFVSAVIFVAIFDLFSSGHDFSLKRSSFVVGAYVVAWLLGLIAPGAPAGIGIRELVLLTLLSGHAAEAELLMAVLLFRISTVIGDILFFFFSSFLNDKSRDTRQAV